MLQRSFLLIGLVGLLMITINQCTTSEDFFSSIYDIEGTNKELYQAHPEWWADDDGDGIMNQSDPDSKEYRRDTLPPIVTIIGPDTVTIALNEPLINVTKKYNHAFDYYDPPDNGKVDTTITNTINPYVDNMNDTPYIMEYRVRDGATPPNETVARRYFWVKTPDTEDKTPPVIMLPTDTIVIAVGTKYDDSDILAWDDVDQDVTSTLQSTGAVNSSVPGIYPVVYTAHDLNNNVATKTRYVVVKVNDITDNIIPVITLIGPDTIFLDPEKNIITEYLKTFVDPGVNAYDPPSNIDLSSRVVASQPTQFNNAYWYIEYTVTDNAGNTSIPVKRWISTGLNSTDQAPVIDLAFPDSVFQIVLPNKTWKEPGYEATEIVNKKVVDITDKVVVDDSVLQANIGIIGEYYILYTVTGSTGLVAQKKRKVEVVDNPFDTEAPVITFKGKNPDTVLVKSSTTYKDSGVTAIDKRDGDVSANVSTSGKVDMTRIGVYKITYTVSDKATNRVTVTRTVYVVVDTETTDLSIRYNVPSPDPLPSITGKFTNFETDGEDGPDLTASVLTEIEWNWINEPNNKQFQFYMKYSAEPYHQDMKKTYSLNNAEPSVTISGSTIPGLDGKYWVTIIDDMMVWVRSDFSFAIRMTE